MWFKRFSVSSKDMAAEENRPHDDEIPEFVKWKRPISEHVEENEKIAATNERRANRMIKRLYTELLASSTGGAIRLKPSRHVPDEPVEELKGVFQIAHAFIPDEHIGKVIRAMGWVLFPGDGREKEKCVDEVCALFPDGSHERDVKRALLLLQDFWLWLDTRPDFDKTRFIDYDVLPVVRGDASMQAFQVLMFIPVRAAFAMFDSMKSFVESRTVSLNEQTRGMVPQLKMLFMIWLVYKKRKMMK